MKKTLCIAAAAILCGCAGMQSSTGSPGNGAMARSSAYYCSKERLNASGDRLECNWQPTAEEACRYGNSSVLQRSAMKGDPEPGGRCSTGQWLVMVAPR